MFEVLELDRIDIAAYGYSSGLDTLAELGIADITAIELPLASAPLYLFFKKMLTSSLDYHRRSETRKRTELWIKSSVHSSADHNTALS